MTNTQEYFPNGFSKPGSPRAIGTTLDKSNGQGVRAIRQKIHKLPSLTFALQWLINEVVKEQRKDKSVQLSQLRMGSDGRLVRYRARDNGYFPTVRALEQLLRLVDSPPHAPGYLAAIPSDRRAIEVNHILQNQNDRPIVLRLRQSTAVESQELYAVCTPKYTPLDPDLIAKQLLRAASSDYQFAETKSEIIFSSERTSLRLYQDSTVSTQELGKGETFASCLNLFLSDDKSTGLNIDVSALRSLCLNLMLVRPDKHGIFSARHLGDAKILLSQIMQSITSGAELLPEFLETYTSAAKVQVHEPALTIQHLAGALISRKSSALLQVNGIKPQQLSERITEAWHQEQDATQKGIANSITRAAHSFSWPSVWTSRDLERQASLLLAMPEPRFRKVIEVPSEHIQITA